MKYFVSDDQRRGTCYHEFIKGEWDGKTFWSKDSICLHDDVLLCCDGLVKALKSVIPNYDPLNVTKIERWQWERAGELIDNADPLSKEVYLEADAWARAVFLEYPCFTVLGI
ncbi:MAG: hypothetical protein IJF16_00470 [Clostridia bacterium]|nr:hypothetical protein [Clostridia bacterium]